MAEPPPLAFRLSLLRLKNFILLLTRCWDETSTRKKQKEKPKREETKEGKKGGKREPQKEGCRVVDECCFQIRRGLVGCWTHNTTKGRLPPWGEPTIQTLGRVVGSKYRWVAGLVVPGCRSQEES